MAMSLMAAKEAFQPFPYKSEEGELVLKAFFQRS
jgi:hypothetical protein